MRWPICMQTHPQSEVAICLVEIPLSQARFRRANEYELRFHIDELTDENIAAGMPPHEARRRAILEFGGAGKVQGRSPRRLPHPRPRRYRCRCGSRFSLHPQISHLFFFHGNPQPLSWPSARTAPSSPPLTPYLSQAASFSGSRPAHARRAAQLQRPSCPESRGTHSPSTTGIASTPPFRASPVTTPRTFPRPPARCLKKSLVPGFTLVFSRSGVLPRPRSRIYS